MLKLTRNSSRTSRGHKPYVDRAHDSLLKKVLKGEKYLKLYSYRYLINGFAVLVTQQQVSLHSSPCVIESIIGCLLASLSCIDVFIVCLW